jgi:translocator protein
MKKDIVRQWIIILTFIVMIAANVLAEALPINGQTTAAISDSFKVVFVPAGYVFSIWGIIYLALLGFTIYQALPSQRMNPGLRKIGYLFVVTNLLNAAWIVLWHYNLYLLTMVVMVALLATLIAIYLRLEIGKTKVDAAGKWLVQVPFSIYLGWISVATIANATALLKYLGWSGFGISGEIWTAILLGVGVVLAGILSWTRHDVPYALVLAWAFIGIAVKWQGAYPIVVVSAFIAAGIVLLDMVLAYIKNRKFG